MPIYANRLPCVPLALAGVRVMDEFESRLDAILGLSRAGNLPDFFDAISPILNQNESLVSKDMRAATAATAALLRVIVEKLSKFDLGQEWVQETKLERNESLLQAALHGAFLLGSLTADVPAAEQYRKSFLRQKAAEARAQEQPRRDVVTNIVREEAEAYWSQFPSSKVSGNVVAGKIMDKVNKRLADAKTIGSSRIGRLGQNAIAKRINELRHRTMVRRPTKIGRLTKRPSECAFSCRYSQA
jgi:hypothetical protein